MAPPARPRPSSPTVTLAGVLFAVLLVAAVAAAAGWFYGRAVEGQRILEARSGLRAVRDALFLYQVRHEGALPADLASLGRSGSGTVLTDPWGKPYRLDGGRRILVSTGPDGRLDGPDAAAPDDLFELLPPPPDVTDLPPPPADDSVAPRIERVWPEGTTTTRRPPVGAGYVDDGGAGVDRSLVRLTVDGADTTAEARVTVTDLQWLPSADLTPGPHAVLVHVQDRTGRATQRAWTFTVR